MIAGEINASSWIKMEYQKSENVLCETWVQQQDCGAYVVSGSNPHISSLLACFEKDKPIYAASIESPMANPFPNLRPIESFSPDGKEKILLFLSEEEALSEELQEVYACRYLMRFIDIHPCYCRFDAYELIPYVH